MSVANDEEKPSRTWRDKFGEKLEWLVFLLFLLTSPVSFPLLVLYKRARGEKIRGKGAGFFFLLWVGMTAVLALAVAIYVQKGFEGFRRLFWIAVIGAIWAIIVFGVIRVLIELIALGFKVWDGLEKRFKK